MSQLDQLEPLDLNDIKDYKVYWTRNLSTFNDTIVSSTWPVVPTGIVKDSDTHDDTTTTIWVHAAPNATGPFKLTNRIVTAGGRTLDQSITIRIKER